MTFLKHKTFNSIVVILFCFEYCDIIDSSFHFKRTLVLCWYLWIVLQVISVLASGTFSIIAEAMLIWCSHSIIDTSA